MSNLSDRLKIGYVVPGIANSLDIDSLGAVINGRGDVLWLVSLDKLGCDAQTRKEDLQLVICTAVQVACSYDVVASVSKRGDGHELCSLARRSCNGCHTPFKGGDALLKNIDSRLKQNEDCQQLHLQPNLSCGELLTFIIRL